MKLSCGSVAQIQAGNITETRVDFACLGGMLIRRALISRRLTASRCSQIASMCQPGMKGWFGSIVLQAAFTNVLSDTWALRLRASANDFSYSCRLTRGLS